MKGLPESLQRARAEAFRSTASRIASEPTQAPGPYRANQRPGAELPAWTPPRANPGQQRGMRAFERAATMQREPDPEGFAPWQRSGMTALELTGLPAFRRAGQAGARGDVGGAALETGMGALGVAGMMVAPSMFGGRAAASRTVTPPRYGANDRGALERGMAAVNRDLTDSYGRPLNDARDTLSLGPYQYWWGRRYVNGRDIGPPRFPAPEQLGADGVPPRDPVEAAQARWSMDPNDPILRGSPDPLADPATQLRGAAMRPRGPMRAQTAGNEDRRWPMFGTPESTRVPRAIQPQTRASDVRRVFRGTNDGVDPYAPSETGWLGPGRYWTGTRQRAEEYGSIISEADVSGPFVTEQQFAARMREFGGPDNPQAFERVKNEFEAQGYRGIRGATQDEYSLWSDPREVAPPMGRAIQPQTRTPDGRSILPRATPQPIRQSLVGGSEDLRRAATRPDARASDTSNGPRRLYSGRAGEQGSPWATPDRRAANDYATDRRAGAASGAVDFIDRDPAGALTVRSGDDIAAALPDSERHLLDRFDDMAKNEMPWEILGNPAVQAALRRNGVSVVHLPRDISPNSIQHESYLFLDPVPPRGPGRETPQITPDVGFADIPRRAGFTPRAQGIGGRPNEDRRWGAFGSMSAPPMARIEANKGYYSLHAPDGGGEFHGSRAAAVASAKRHGWQVAPIPRHGAPESMNTQLRQRIANQRLHDMTNAEEARIIGLDEGLDAPPPMWGVKDLAGASLRDAMHQGDGRVLREMLDGELGPFSLEGRRARAPLLGVGAPLAASALLSRKRRK